MTSPFVAIGLDLGTSSIKAVAIDESARVLARARRGYPTRRPEARAAEQSPGDWFEAAVAVLREIAGSVEPGDWGVIGLSGMLPTLVVLDAELRPVGDALTWEDGRAEDQGRALRASIGAGALYRTTGQRVDGRYLLPMYRRRADAGETGDRPTVAGAKDYLFHQLTDELLTDPSTAAGYGAFDLHTSTWRTEVLDAVGGPAVPEVQPSAAHRGLRRAVAELVGCRSGIPVVLGAADSVLGAYGLGVEEAGQVAYIAGTSTVVLGCSADVVLDPEQRYLVTPMADRGYGMEMDQLATGAAIAWLAALTGFAGAEEVMAAAGSCRVDAAPLFLPYLAPGEQGALWDPLASGAVHGLTLTTSRDQLARGLVSGIVLESRRCVSVLEGALGETPVREIVMSGGGARSRAFRQDLADATGWPVTAAAGENDHSALGAARFAAESLGHRPERSSGTQETVQTSAPDARRTALWDELALRHDEAREAVRLLPAGSPHDERHHPSPHPAATPHVEQGEHR